MNTITMYIIHKMNEDPAFNISMSNMNPAKIPRVGDYISLGNDKHSYPSVARVLWDYEKNVVVVEVS